MRRRELLKYVSAGAVVGMTGCLSEGNGSPGNETDDGDGTGDGGNGTTVTDSSFSVVSEGGGDREESASFWFEEGTLRVRGVIVGSDLCKTAELESAEYDGERGALVVSVVTVDAEDAPDACGEALKPIEYEATVSFEGEQPSVVVTHDGEEVEAEQGKPDGVNGTNATLTESEFEVTGSECGTETNEAEYTASQGMSEEEVSEGVVEGTLSGPDACTTAELGYVSYDAEEDTLVADVRTARTDEDGCADCVTEVSYRLVAEFENGVADSAAVSHDGVRVGALERGGVEDTEFTVEGVQGGSGDEEVSDAEFNEDEGTVVVSGTVIGNELCTTARLAEAYVEDGALSVDVETVRNSSGMCGQGLVAIEYTATLSFDGEIPNEVSVSHDGTGVMSGAYASESASVGPSDE